MYWVMVKLLCRDLSVRSALCCCRFWGLLTDNLYLHRPSALLPFVSTFCQGFGKGFYKNGQVCTRPGRYNFISLSNIIQHLGLVKLFINSDWMIIVRATSSKFFLFCQFESIISLYVSVIRICIFVITTNANI